MTDEKTAAVITAKANEIAHMIVAIDTDFRGELLLAVASRLRGMGQNYTGASLATAARQYGYAQAQETPQ